MTRGDTLKKQLALLRELQRIDLDLDELTKKKGEIQSRLAQNREVLERLVSELDNQKSELEEIRGLQRSKQMDLTEIHDNLKERKKRLLNVGSTKEYNAVEREIEVLQKSAEQTEEETLQLQEVVSDTEDSIKTKQGMVKELQEGIAQEDSNAETELGALDKHITKLNNRAEEARTEVPKRVLYKYDFIRSRRPGLAIVAARSGHCEGCYMSLPPQLFIQIQRAETLETCPSCQRILYFWEDALGEDPMYKAAE